MIFEIHYNKNNSLTNENNYREYSYVDNHESVISDICGVFAENGNVVFNMLNLSTEKLQEMDIQFDLAIGFSQIVEYVDFCSHENWDGVIDFFEQGTNLSYIFEEQDDLHVLLMTVDFLTKEKLGDSKIFTKKALLEALQAFVKDFFNISNILCPRLIKEDIFVEWLESKVI